MKRISFKVAKAIKEAGYPQDYKNEDVYTNLNGGIWVKPLYLEVWLWLCREKKMLLSIQEFCGEWNVYSPQAHGHIAQNFTDPEGAIIAAIEYLVDNDLIK